jgi:hypothetical protein
VTCAHVIGEALGLSDLTEQPSGLVTIDFPQSAHSEVRMTSVMAEGWFPARPGLRTGDLAMLEVLGDEVRGIDPALLRPAGSDNERVFGVLGHPTGYDMGVWAFAKLTGIGGPGREWIQLDALASNGSRIQSGFSGAGLLDEDDGAVVGVVVAAGRGPQERGPQDRVAWVIPVEVICGYWPDLRARLGPAPLTQRAFAAGAPLISRADVERLALMMLELRGISDRPSRGLFIAAIENRFDGRLVVQRQDDDLQDTAALIETCLEHPGALHELIERLRVYHSGGAGEWSHVGEIVAIAEQFDPAPLLDASNRNGLYRILAELADRITSDMVGSAYREAAGLMSSEAITAYDVPSVIRVLESAMTAADGLPPLLHFLEGLSRRLPTAAADNLRSWVDDFARREDIPRHLLSRLRLSRPPSDSGQTKFYLLAELLGFGAGHERYLSKVTLLQGDRRRWPPNARLVRDGSLPLHAADIPPLFESILSDIRYLPDVGELVIEFLLPLELLSLPVDQWQVEEGERARPLCVEHHVIVRYRDRPQIRSGYGQWQGRTRRLRNGGATVQWVDPNNMAAVGRLSGQLLRGGAPCLALEQPPPKPGRTLSSDAVSTAISMGVPVIIWCRDGVSAKSFVARLRSHLAQQGVLDLPTLVQQIRHEFIEFGNPAGEHITLVWDLEDEPTSLVTRYQAPG